MPQTDDRSQNESGTQEIQSQNEGQQEGEEQSQSQDGSGTQTGSEGLSFNHPRLKGKTPQEVEQMFNLYEQTLREQGRALNERGAEGVQPTGRPSERQGGPPTSTDDGEADFWQNPKKVMRGMLEEMITPFRQNLLEGQAMTARQQIMDEFSDYGDYEDVIDAMFQRSNQPKNLQTMRAMYYMAKGMASSGALGDRPAPQGRSSEQPMNIPQHRPSSTPPPASSPKGKKRALTESERTIARASGLSDEQYLAWLDEDITDIAESKIGAEAQK